MSRTRGKREAVSGGRHMGGDPFQEEQAAGREEKEKRSGRGRRAALITLGVIAGLAVVAVGAWKLFVKPIDVSGNDRPGVQDKTPEGEKPAGPTDETGGDAQLTGGRKEDYFTFLLLGKDVSSGSTDTILLASYDVPNGAVNLMTIPRDTMVNLDRDMKKINSIYASKMGVEGLKDHVAYLTGIRPDAYVLVEWEAIGRIVDALEGVQFYVPYNMDYDDPYQDLHIHQMKGDRLLSGSDAMQVIRWRGNNNDSPYGYHKEDYGIGDTGRQQVQQDFLKALAKQCLQLGNWTKVSEFAKIFAENVETDLTLANILWFAKPAMGIQMENIQFFTMPGDLNSYAWSRTYKNNQSYAFADPAGVVELVNQHFNPYSADITEDDLQIMYKNKNGSLGVTNGTLADEKAASAPVKPPKPPKEEKPKEPTDPILPEEGGEVTAPDTDTEIDPGTETDPDSGMEPGTDPGTGPETDPGTDTGSEPVTEPDVDPSAEPELPPEPTLPPEENGSEQMD